jgi:hypothetical protein
MIRIVAGLCALAALGAYELYLVALLGLSLTPWGIATVVAALAVLVFFFVPTPRAYWVLLLVGALGAALPVLGGSAQIYSTEWTGQELQDGRLVPMGPPALGDHLLASIIMFATLLALCLASLVLWKRVVFRRPQPVAAG